MLYIIDLHAICMFPMSRVHVLFLYSNDIVRVVGKFQLLTIQW